jgi:hypothetical protein
MFSYWTWFFIAALLFNNVVLSGDTTTNLAFGALLVVSFLTLGQTMKENREDKVHLNAYPDGAYGLSYEYPRKFHSYKIVYDPTVIDFDSYRITVKDVKNQRTTARITTKGTKLASDPDKFVIEAFTTNGFPSSYDPKSQSRIVYIELQLFFANRMGRADLVDRIRRGVQFRKYRTKDTYEVIPLGSGFA